MISFTVRDGSVTFSVRAQPRASRTSLAGEMEGALRVKLAAPPVDGAANEELVTFLAKLWHVPRRQVEIISGDSARTKIVRITGITETEFLAAIEG